MDELDRIGVLFVAVGDGGEGPIDKVGFGFIDFVIAAAPPAIFDRLGDDREEGEHAARGDVGPVINRQDRLAILLHTAVDPAHLPFDHHLGVDLDALVARIFILLVRSRRIGGFLLAQVLDRLTGVVFRLLVGHADIALGFLGDLKVLGAGRRA